mmetsp:Transcript_18118/g.39489  ORF Transcript_18118/g.39489 Transcript_18118/m.39489 type:complete len:117 (-) Transcript_18118:285-635(-)
MLQTYAVVSTFNEGQSIRNKIQSTYRVNKILLPISYERTQSIVQIKHVLLLRMRFYRSQSYSNEDIHALAESILIPAWFVSYHFGWQITIISTSISSTNASSTQITPMKGRIAQKL